MVRSIVCVLCITMLVASRVPAVPADPPGSGSSGGELTHDELISSASFQRSIPGCGDTITGSTFGANNVAFASTNTAGDHLYLL